MLILGSSAGSSFVAWPLYRGDLNNSGAVPGPRSVSALRLRERWTYRSKTWITSTPVVAGTLVYAGTWGGDVLAIDARTGRLRWSRNLGANPNQFYGQSRGVIPSVAVVDGVAYAVSGSCEAGAFDAIRGTPVWHRRICSIVRNDDTYASPVAANGVVLFGIDVLGDMPTDRGSIVALDAATGALRWRMFPERYRGTGTGISATPAVDVARDIGFVGTGNPTPRGAPPPGPDAFSESVIAFDVRTGARRWAFGPVHPHDKLDRDLFASPNRFSVGSGSHARWVIGEAGKDDVYYALDERTGKELWRRRLVASPSASVIGTPAVSDGRIFVPVYDGARGWLVVLSTRNGGVLWRRALGAGAYEAPVVWGSVVFVTDVGGELHAFDARNGRALLRRYIGGRLYGRGPSVAEASLYVASAASLARYDILTP